MAILMFMAGLMLSVVMGILFLLACVSRQLSLMEIGRCAHSEKYKEVFLKTLEKDRKSFMALRLIVTGSGIVWLNSVLTVSMAFAEGFETFLPSLLVCLPSFLVYVWFTKRYLPVVMALILEAHEQGKEASCGTK